MSLAVLPSRVVRNEMLPDRFLALEGAVHELVSTSCTSGIKSLSLGAENQLELLKKPVIQPF